MDFSMYDPFSDPVILISDEGVVQHINPVGRAWLTNTDGEEIAGKPLDHFVFFSETKMFTLAGDLKNYEFTPHEDVRFRFPYNNYESTARVCIQKIPYGEHSLYAIIVRDLIFAESLKDNKSIDWKSPVVAAEAPASVANTAVQKTDETTDTLVSPVAVAADTAVSHHLDLTLTKSMTKDRMARYETRMNIFVVELKLALIGRSIILGHGYVDAEVKANNLTLGLLCNLEVQGTPEMKAMSMASKITEINRSGPDWLRIRFQFENLGGITRRAIDEYLAKYSTSF
jgi:hypothetical protein